MRGFKTYNITVCFKINSNKDYDRLMFNCCMILHKQTLVGIISFNQNLNV